jgi:hypothetical protein
MGMTAFLTRERLEKIRNFVSAGLCYWSILLLILSFVAVSLAWLHAFRDNRIPEVWGTFEGNHGPWRHYYAGRELIFYAVIFPFKCIFYSIFSVLIKKSRLGIWLIITSVLVFFLMMYTHYWLID